jgi:CRISPR/Cas system-associated exonuclease Cas4 (RecB family)
LESVLPDDARLFPDIELINKWRDWHVGLRYTSKQGVKFIGALDDCIEIGGLLAPLDYKTRGSAPKDDGSSQKYYGLQLSMYSFLLKQAGYKVTKKGYLVYYFPTKAGDLTRIEFSIKVVQLEADPKFLIDTTVEALKILNNPKPPLPVSGCEFCSYREGA